MKIILQYVAHAAFFVDYNVELSVKLRGMLPFWVFRNFSAIMTRYCG